MPAASTTIPDTAARPAEAAGASLTLHDWRIAEGCADGLTEIQRGPWALVLRPEGYGCTLNLTGPDGRSCTVAIEIDRGAPVLRTYREDIPDTKLRVSEGATEIESPENIGPLKDRRLAMTPEAVTWIPPSA